MARTPTVVDADEVYPTAAAVVAGAAPGAAYGALVEAAFGFSYVGAARPNVGGVFVNCSDARWAEYAAALAAEAARAGPSPRAAAALWTLFAANGTRVRPSRAGDLFRLGIVDPNAELRRRSQRHASPIALMVAGAEGRCAPAAHRRADIIELSRLLLEHGALTRPFRHDVLVDRMFGWKTKPSRARPFLYALLRAVGSDAPAFAKRFDDLARTYAVSRIPAENLSELWVDYRRAFAPLLAPSQMRALRFVPQHLLPRDLYYEAGEFLGLVRRRGRRQLRVSS